MATSRDIGRSTQVTGAAMGTGTRMTATTAVVAAGTAPMASTQRGSTDSRTVSTTAAVIAITDTVSVRRTTEITGMQIAGTIRASATRTSTKLLTGRPTSRDISKVITAECGGGTNEVRKA